MEPRGKTRQGRVGMSLCVAALVGLAMLTFYPFIFMIITSLKSAKQYYANIWLPAWPLHLENYQQAWAAIAPYMLNSFVVTVASTIGVVVVSCLAAFAFARMSFPGREILYYLVIFLLMVPAVLTLVPTFLLIKNVGLMNTLWALILPYIAAGQVLSIFIMRAFFASLPEELFEAARIDGASEWWVFLNIAVPLVRPVLVTIAILQVLSSWNDYVWPFLVLQSDSVQTLVVGLVNFQGRFYTDYGPLMAGYALASIPLLILFFVAMRSFIEGLSQGALKA
jgi:ABC-type glycerol-3-phosphate transport system permease component